MNRFSGDIVPGHQANTSQRKSLVLMFADISNSTLLSSAMEIEDYAEIIDRFRACLNEVMASHVGTIIRLDGDGALCTFGYPDPLEDAGRRAVEAALDFHELIARRVRLPDGRALQVHTGVHAGIVGVQAGDSVRGLIEVLGMPTNIAARLCELARPDAIVASEDVLGMDRDFFRLAMAGHYAVNGDEPSVRLFRVLGRTTATAKLMARRQGHSSPLLGRDADLLHVRRWLSDTRSKLMLVTGEAGIGKSRFIAELLASLPHHGIVAAVGSCEAYPASHPMQALRQIATALAPAAAAAWPDAQLPDLLKAQFGKLSPSQDWLIIIDDWQWADDATVSFFDWLVTQSGPRIKLLLTSREGDARVAVASGQERLDLSTLSATDATALIATLLPSLDPLATRKVAAAAGGNPLLIEEICRDSALLRGGTVGSRASLRLNALILRRLASLPAPLADAVKTCAMTGLQVPVYLVADVLGWTETEEWLVRLQATGFVHVDQATATLHFRHGLIRDAVYAHVSVRDRRRVHRQIAHALLTRHEASGHDRDLDALAYHLAQSNHPLALEFAIRAGDRALSIGSLDQALVHFRAVIDLLVKQEMAVTSDDIGRIGARYISAALPDPHSDHLPPLTMLADFAERRGLADASAKARYWTASLHYVVGNPRAALRIARTLTSADPSRGIAGFGAGQDALFTALSGQSLMLDNHHPRALDLMNQAIGRLGMQANPKQHQSLVYMLGLRGQIVGDQGHFTAAFADFAAAGALVGPSPPAMFGTVMSQRAAVELWAERHDACRTTMMQSRDLGDRVGSRYVMMISRALLAYVDWLQDHDPAALPTLDRSIGWFEESGSRYSLALALGWAADVAMQLGENRRAAGYAQRSIALGVDTLRWGAPLALRVAALVADDAAQARAHLRRAYALAARMQSPRERAEALLCEAALHARDGRDAVAARCRADANQLRLTMGLAPR